MTHKYQKLIDDGVVVAVDENTVRLTSSAWKMMTTATAHLEIDEPRKSYKGHSLYSKKDDL